MLIRLFISIALIVLAASIFINIKGSLEARFFLKNDQPYFTIEIFNPWIKTHRLARIQSSLSSLPLDRIITLCKSSKADLMELAAAGFKATNLILGMVVIQRLEWKSVVGVGDAMGTALLNGSLWAFKGWMVSIVSRKAKLQNLDLNVKPDFKGKNFESRLYCIFKIRIVHIIFMTVYLLVLISVKRPKFGYLAQKRTRG